MKNTCKLTKLLTFIWEYVTIESTVQTADIIYNTRISERSPKFMKIRYNEDTEVVERIREGLKKKEGCSVCFPSMRMILFFAATDLFSVNTFLNFIKKHGQISVFLAINYSCNNYANEYLP